VPDSVTSPDVVRLALGLRRIPPLLVPVPVIASAPPLLVSAVAPLNCTPTAAPDVAVPFADRLPLETVRTSPPAKFMPALDVTPDTLMLPEVVRLAELLKLTP